jgi:hypothetical protein
MFAQKFPEVFDGIAAAAPAINWSSFFFSSTFPQQVLSELTQNGLKRFPHECEFLSLRTAAIAACDANGGPVDGLISDMASCKFDARSMIGSPSNCSSSGAPSVISEAAAMAMNALWQGAQTSDGSFLWYPHGYQTDPTAFYGTLDNTCSDNGTCVPERNTLFTHWIKYFVKKDPDFDLNNMTRQDFVRAFNAGTRDYNSIIDTDYPDLREFRAAGGKLLTYHGLVSPTLPQELPQHKILTDPSRQTNRSHMVERVTIMIEYLLSILPCATFTVISKSPEQHTVKLAKVVYLPACFPLWSTGLRMVLRPKRLSLGTLKIKNVCFVNTRRRQYSLETLQTTLRQISYASEEYGKVAVND